MLPCVNCCVTACRFTPMPMLLPLIALAYMSANSARDDLAPKVLALATLLPITSRFLLDAFRPDRPCWKLMRIPWLRCSSEVTGSSVDGAHGAVVHRAGP